MTRALVITNPAAARTDRDAVRVVERILRRGGWQADVLVTGGGGDARRYAAEGVRAGVDVVAVFGGDGTTMQAAAALVGTGVALGVLPGGTGNLLAGNLRIPTHPQRAAELLLESRPRAFDLGRMERQDGTHFFAVACGAGFDARVMEETPAAFKRQWGMGAYIATTLKILPEVRSTDTWITVDGTEHRLRSAMVLVANCGEVIPPLIRLRSGISPRDGLLDVIAIRADSVGQSVLALWDLLREVAVDDDDRYVTHLRGREISVRAAEALPVQLDGEMGGLTPFAVQVVPNAIQVMVPEGTTLP
ncbi:MAG TPA: diacylglycerol kinase family protein [Gemmatimonadales bacterium]|nr:diacylglycerol kinase family protein [Gemmatimonadales bacterium]